MRDTVTLECSECKHRNYTTTRSKKRQTTRFEFKKYCRFCRGHKLHKEIK